MKTRHGFVSNSSSSSFVIAIPLRFKLSDILEPELVNRLLEVSDCVAEEDEPGNKLTEVQWAIGKIPDLKSTLAALRSGKVLWKDDYTNTAGALSVHFFSNLAAEKGWLIAEIDTTSDGGQLVNIITEKNKEKLTTAMEEE